jgi:hypothetical protein
MLARFYMSPPANLWEDWLLRRRRNLYTALIPISVCAFLVFLSRVLIDSAEKIFTLGNYVFRSLFKKKTQPLTGTPGVRRLKTYSAQSGYVYQYYYEGHRDFRSSGESGIEFVFSISADRKNWTPTSVLVSDEAVRDWEASHSRQLSSTERYAIAKIALFQAFDERSTPALMNDEVRVRNADIDGIIETLGL